MEEREMLQEFVLSPGWDVLMKTISNIVDTEDNRLLTYNLEKGAQGLVEEKARSEGAHRLKRLILNIKPTTKQQGYL